MNFNRVVQAAVRAIKKRASLDDRIAVSLFLSRASERSRTALEKAVQRALEVEGSPGCCKLQKSREGTTVGLYRSAEAGIETDPEWPWATVCEPHGGVVCHRTRAEAEAALSHPKDWCPTCQEER